VTGQRARLARIIAAIMAIFRITDSSIEKVEETTFAREKLLERRDLQRRLKANISVLSPDLMVIGEEFGDWEDSSRRIDLLCLDKNSHLVVVELKRTEDGGHMELQAVRYAAMVSSMTFEQLVGAHARFLGGENSLERAQSAIINFLEPESPDKTRLSEEVRIFLVSADFSIELTTTVLWLNKIGLDITCIRLKPYNLDGQVLMDIQQLIPLPEAEEYETKIRAQQQENRLAETSRHAMHRRFWRQLIERSRTKTALFSNRTGSKDQWIGVTLGRVGFNLSIVLLREETRVECYIDFGKNLGEKNLAVFKTLEQQKQTIEASFGEKLDWQELEDSRACRICTFVKGGWDEPEAEWGKLQDELVDTAIRLEKALKAPIQSLSIPKE
jgi:hypothetical protein